MHVYNCMYVTLRKLSTPQPPKRGRQTGPQKPIDETEPTNNATGNRSPDEIYTIEKSKHELTAAPAPSDRTGKANTPTTHPPIHQPYERPTRTEATTRRRWRPNRRPPPPNEVQSQHLAPKIKLDSKIRTIQLSDKRFRFTN